MQRNYDATLDFDPQALASLTAVTSTLAAQVEDFDPQALASLTVINYLLYPPLQISIHRLLRA